MKSDVRRVTKVENLIKDIFEKHTPYSPATESQLDAFERRTGFTLPTDMRKFYRYCNGALLFKTQSYFSQRILPINEVRRTRIYIFGNEHDVDEFAPSSWYAICDVMDGNYVGIDFASLNSDQMTCSIIDCFHETHGTPGANKIIAKSFTEFLRRILQSDGDEYWLKENFVGYGDALK